MSSVKSKDTKPEMWVRRYLHGHNIRYRLHNSTFAGKPDIISVKRKFVVNINGCFWHGHKNCTLYNFPKSNIEFWINKISKNVSRDTKNVNTLKSMGFRVFTIWECQIRTKKKREQTLSKLVKKIKSENF